MSETALPSWWVQVPLAEVALPVAATDPSADPDALFDYIDIGSVSGQKGIVEATRSTRGAEAPSRARQLVREGDVLFSTVRPYLRAIAQVPAVARPIASTGFCVVRPAKGVDARYLLHRLRSDEFVEALLPYQRGSSYPAVRDGDVLGLTFPLPPADEQRRIASVLDECLSGVDSACTELAAAKRKLALYRQSLLKSAVEGTLTAEWRARNHQQPAVADGQTEGWVPLPASWRWAGSATVCGFITKGTTPPKSLHGQGERSVPFLRVTNLTHLGVLDCADQVFVTQEVHRGLLARSVVFPGDVLMNIVGPPLGQVSVVPATYPEWNINQAIAIFRALDGLLNQYLAYTLLSPGALRWLEARAKTTAGQTNLTLEVCRALPIPLPPPAEQAEVVRLLEEQFAVVSAQSEAIDRALALAAAQRQNILRAAFSGRLVPQDPNDEPASVLLERIRAERATQGHGAASSRRRKAKIAA